MPRATTKIDLIKMANDKFDELWKMIDSMDDAEQNATFCFDTEKAGAEAHWKRDKNLRDVLIHLYEWHRLLIDWEKANSKGEKKPFLPEPYNWKTYGEMNVGFWQSHQKTALQKAKEQLKESHKAVLAIIERYTDEQLFVKSFYKWTGTSSFGQYCISTTASHYDWAMKKLKEQAKACKME